MADPTRLTHTSTLARETLGGIIEFVAYLCGLTSADFAAGTVDRTILVKIINRAQNKWRIYAPVKGFGEQYKDYEWAGGGGTDPASGDMMLLLPDDFAEFRSGSEILVLDSDGDPSDTIPVMSRENYNRSFSQGQSPYTHIQNFVAICELLDNTNKRRIVEIYPAPADGDKFRVPYFSRVELLVNDADELEAPVDLHEAISIQSAVDFLRTGRGSSEKLEEYKAELRELSRLWRSPDARERKRPRRVRSFLEHGYSVFEPPQAEPRPLRINRVTQ